MMGSSDGQKNIFHTVQLEDLVPDDHPLRRIRPLIGTARIRELCADFYRADNGRTSIPPEQIFLAMLGGYLLGCRSDRDIIRHLTCDMALRWFAKTFGKKLIRSVSRLGAFPASGRTPISWNLHVHAALSDGC